MPFRHFRSCFVPTLLWAWLAWHLHYTWQLDEQYRYGAAVPLLVALLLHARWRERPKPARARREAPLVVQAILLALLLPVRVIEEANPDWRLLSWIFALIVVAYTLTLFYRAGGRAWLRHFSFPVCFALVAVPWLVQFENVVVQTLTRAVAGAAVEVASWLGLGAYQIGNIIQLRNGFVGVDEACSGVRTLQTAIMVSLFLGELLRMTAARRVLLVAISCGWVFVCNVARAATLVSIAGTRGFDALHRAHDVVGACVMIVGLLGIVAAALLLRQRDVAQAVAPVALNVASTSSSLEAIGAIIWLALVFGATELWYRAHERELLAVPEWRVRWPADAQPVAIGDSTRAILRYNYASSAAWRTPGDDEWWGFYARWEPHRTAAQLVRSHSPEICLPAIGRTFEAELPPLRIDSAGASLPFRFYRFAQNGKPLFVVVCIQEDKLAPGAAALPEWSTRGRLEAAWNGRRNLGQRLLELALLGATDSDEAARQVAQLVPIIVRAPTTD
jgi:exosortase